MDQLYIQIAAVVASVVFVLIITLHGLLAMGFPLGALTLGGYYPGKLPVRLRVVSMVSMWVLSFFTIIVLQHTHIIAVDIPLSTSYGSSQHFWGLTQPPTSSRKAAKRN